MPRGTQTEEPAVLDGRRAVVTGRDYVRVTVDEHTVTVAGD